MITALKNGKKKLMKKKTSKRIANAPEVFPEAALLAMGFQCKPTDTKELRYFEYTLKLQAMLHIQVTVSYIKKGRKVVRDGSYVELGSSNNWIILEHVNDMDTLTTVVKCLSKKPNTNGIRKKA